MIGSIFNKQKRHDDYCVRCYLTVKCSGGCEFCSAQIPQATFERKTAWVAPALWADGLNSRARHAILAGGEPFMYDGFEDLISMLTPTYKVEIYTNLGHPVERFIEAAGSRHFMLLVSLHPSANLPAWRRRVDQLAAAGHGLRFHVVRAPGYERLAEFLETSGLVGRFQTSLQGDQRTGPKSRGLLANSDHPRVRCTSRIFLFGPDGYRYHCVHHLVKGTESARVGSIFEPDTPIETKVTCREFGLCSGCDNNIAGTVEDL